MVDRALRHLLTDITGNTHRAEFCIDKLYSPDSARGRLGLLELRGFEMPPHAQMALVQALLVRSLVSRFWDEPLQAPLIRHGDDLHGRYLLPHYVIADIAEVAADLRAHGIDFQTSWLDPFTEFRFPRLGSVTVGEMELELRWAIEPWHVLGEEATAGGTARYVDSSVERLQVSLTGAVRFRAGVGDLQRLPGAAAPDAHPRPAGGRRPVPGLGAAELAAPDHPAGLAAGVRRGGRRSAGCRWAAPPTTSRIRVAAVLRDPPVNAMEAEARRTRRFDAAGHSPARSTSPSCGNGPVCSPSIHIRPGHAGPAPGPGHLPVNHAPGPATSCSPEQPMTAGADACGRRPRSSLVEAYLARSGMFTPGVGDPRRYDEMTGTDGSLLPGWTELAAELDAIGELGLSALTGQVDRLLEDDGVTYTPVDAAAGAARRRPGRCRNAGGSTRCPLVVGDAEWARLEAGLIQRSTLLDAVLDRPVRPGQAGRERVAARRNWSTSTRTTCVRRTASPFPARTSCSSTPLDVCRDVTGEFQALGDRTQAPSGAGYAMADRRVVSKVLPDLFRRSAPRGLSAFFHTMRSALASVAPSEAEDPRVVVLTPGTHSETAFDQAMLASLLGVPLVESADLTIRRGRLWMRSMGRFEPVDVVVRRVDAAWSDPLDLRAGLPARRRRAGRGVPPRHGDGGEHPGQRCAGEPRSGIPFLPKLARAVLGENLKMPSVPTFWCGDEAEPLARAGQSGPDGAAARPAAGSSVFPAMMIRAELDSWRLRLEAEPTRWVGQQVAPFSEAPMAAPEGLVAGQVSMRLFTVAHGSGYVAMPGSLGRVQDCELTTAGRGRSSVAKDVWVRSAGPRRRTAGRAGCGSTRVRWCSRIGRSRRSSPRVLEDMFWLGRYAERTEDLIRLLIVARERVDDFRFRPEHLGAGCVPVLLSAVPRYRAPAAFATDAEPTAADPRPDAGRRRERHGGPVDGRSAGIRALGSRPALRRHLDGAGGHRPGGRPNSPSRAGRRRHGAGVTQAAVLSGMLALSGLISENMVRDPGWYFMDLGRRMERAQQVTALLRATLTRSHSSAVDSLVVESVLAASESGVTYRRRYRGRIQVATMLELLLLDAGNPRSLAYQVAQARADLRALPDSSGTSRPQRRLEDVDATLRRARPGGSGSAWTTTACGRELLALLDGLHESLRGIADAIAAQHFWHPSPMQSLGVVTLRRGDRG